MEQPIFVSIIVCTYNRAESLRDTLGALQALHLRPNITVEALVVDNNSSDHTQTVVQEFRQNWPALRYTFEAAQGLSHARNRGIQETAGTIVVFTDDDVLPEPDWLLKLIDGIDFYKAEAVGGYIAPIWETPPPSWLTERFYGFLAIRTDRTDDYPVCSKAEAPFGANMAFRRGVFDTIGLFNTARGRKGHTLAGGEDIEMFERILNNGGTVYFLGSAKVNHKVEGYRLRKSYFRRWRLQTSKNIAVANDVVGSRRIFNIPLYMFSHLGRAMIRAIIGRFSDDESEALHRDMIACHFLGTILGLWQQRNAATAHLKTANNG